MLFDYRIRSAVLFEVKAFEVEGSGSSVFPDFDSQRSCLWRYMYFPEIAFLADCFRATRGFPFRNRILALPETEIRSRTLFEIG